MNRQITYDISTLVPYVNWIYFYYAWGVGNQGDKERDQLRQEAEQRLSYLDGKYHTHAIFGLFDANSDGDDVVVWPEGKDEIRIPFLRQQHPVGSEELNLCLSDFIRPISSGQKDTIGLFATTVDHAMETDTEDDPFSKMMAQTLADRLAEATAERMHEEVRRHYWGYAPDEHLTMQ